MHRSTNLYQNAHPLDLRLKFNYEIKKAIVKHGVFIVSTEDFTYSIGHAYHNLPEIIIYTPAMKSAYMLIMELHKHWKEHGYKAGLNTEIIEGLEGQEMPIYIEEIEHPTALQEEYITQAFEFYHNNPEYKKEPLRCVQVFFPDEKGRLPFEPDFNEKFAQKSLVSMIPPTIYG